MKRTMKQYIRAARAVILASFEDECAALNEGIHREAMRVALIGSDPKDYKRIIAEAMKKPA